MIVGALFLAAAGMSRVAVAEPALGEQARVRALATILKCLTCQGESVADSQAPIAVAMRETVREQVEAGWDDDAVRSWFVARYGEAILLTPPRHGLPAVLWLAPQLAIVVTAGLLAARRRRAGHALLRYLPGPPLAWGGQQPRAARTRGADPPGGRRPPRVPARVFLVTSMALLAITGGAVAGVVIDRRGRAAEAHAEAGGRVEALRAQAADDPADPQAWMALGRELEQRGDVPAAITAYERASRLGPDDSGIGLRLAFAHLKAGQEGLARPLLEAILAREPDHPEALLLLGTLQRSAGEPQGGETLRHFLRVAGDHPAAAQIRRMLGEGG